MFLSLSLTHTDTHTHLYIVIIISGVLHFFKYSNENDFIFTPHFSRINRFNIYGLESRGTSKETTRFKPQSYKI